MAADGCCLPRSFHVAGTPEEVTMTTFLLAWNPARWEWFDLAELAETT
jgi:hypothetical protein